MLSIQGLVAASGDVGAALVISAVLGGALLFTAVARRPWVAAISRAFGAGAGAMPALLATMLIVSLGAAWPGRLELIVALAFVATMRFMRLAEGEIAELARQTYWRMLPGLGVSWSARVTRHYLPVLGGVLARYLPLEAMELFALHATCAFFGLGIDVSDQSIGRLIAVGRSYLDGAPWLFWGPAALLSAALAGLWGLTAFAQRDRNGYQGYYLGRDDVR